MDITWAYGHKLSLTLARLKVSLNWKEMRNSSCQRRILQWDGSRHSNPSNTEYYYAHGLMKMESWSTRPSWRPLYKKMGVIPSLMESLAFGFLSMIFFFDNQQAMSRKTLTSLPRASSICSKELKSGWKLMNKLRTKKLANSQSRLGMAAGGLRYRWEGDTSMRR